MTGTDDLDHLTYLDVTRITRIHVYEPEEGAYREEGSEGNMNAPRAENARSRDA